MLSRQQFLSFVLLENYYDSLSCRPGQLRWLACPLPERYGRRPHGDRAPGLANTFDTDHERSSATKFFEQNEYSVEAIPALLCRSFPVARHQPFQHMEAVSNTEERSGPSNIAGSS